MLSLRIHFTALQLFVRSTDSTFSSYVQFIYFLNSLHTINNHITKLVIQVINENTYRHNNSQCKYKVNKLYIGNYLKEELSQ